MHYKILSLTLLLLLCFSCKKNNTTTNSPVDESIDLQEEATEEPYADDLFEGLTFGSAMIDVEDEVYKKSEVLASAFNLQSDLFQVTDISHIDDSSDILELKELRTIDKHTLKVDTVGRFLLILVDKESHQMITDTIRLSQKEVYSYNLDLNINYRPTAMLAIGRYDSKEVHFCMDRLLIIDDEGKIEEDAITDPNINIYDYKIPIPRGCTLPENSDQLYTFSRTEMGRKMTLPETDRGALDNPNFWTCIQHDFDEESYSTTKDCRASTDWKTAYRYFVYSDDGDASFLRKVLPTKDTIYSFGYEANVKYKYLDNGLSIELEFAGGDTFMRFQNEGENALMTTEYCPQ